MTMESLQAGDLKIEVAQLEDPPRTQLCWLGKSNERQPDKVLGPFFAAALEECAANGRTLEMHFEDLEHFNSSTIMSMIHLIREARSRGVKLVLVFDPKRKWQKLSFDAFRVFDKSDALFALKPLGGA
jgi:hypothetical protein